MYSMKEMNDKDSMGKSVHLPTHMFLIKTSTKFLIECCTVFGQGNFTRSVLIQYNLYFVYISNQCLIPLKNVNQ